MKLNGGKVIQFALALLMAEVAAYFATAFFTNFYVGAVALVLLSVLFSILFTALGYFSAGEILARLRAHGRREFVGVLTLLLAAGLAIATIRLGLKFPTLFDRRILFLGSGSLPVFLGAGLASFGGCASLLVFLERRGVFDAWRDHRLVRFLRANLTGFLLTGLFFLTYFTLAETVNFPGFRTLDQYFDLDISSWLARLQAVSPRDITDTVRAVHPAVLLFLRLPVWLVSLLLNGNRLHAIFVVHALAASACVFFAWRIVRRVSGSATFALVAASLLGASASHLVLGSMLDTYIYSAAAILFFISVLQNDPVPLRSASGTAVSLRDSVVAGIFVFGTTITNILQTLILYFARLVELRNRRDDNIADGRSRFRRFVYTRSRDTLSAGKVLLQFVLWVVGIVLLLNVIQVWRYPAATPLTPNNIRYEQGYRVDFEDQTWRLLGRANLMARAVLSYGVLAPKPFVLTTELGMKVPNFRTFAITVGEFHVAGYEGLADMVAKLWAVILLIVFALFLRSWFRKPRPWFSLGLLACLGFNFALHVLYGDDPMLYSPDWTYALILFVTFSLNRFARKKWVQAAALVFLALAVIVNLGLMREIMQVSAPFYGR